MHRISCFGPVSSSTFANYQIQFWCIRQGQNIFTPFTIELSFVKGITGPRLETQKKGNTITGWPGGPVHSVDHSWLEGICYPEQSGGYERLFEFSLLPIVVPCAPNEYWDPSGYVDFASLYLGRGGCKARLVSVSFEKGLTASDPCYVLVRVHVVSRTLPPYTDQYISWLCGFELRCPVSGDGDYLMEHAYGLYPHTAPQALTSYPSYPPYPTIKGYGAATKTMSNEHTTMTTIPYLESILCYWRNEKLHMSELFLDKAKVRDCTLSALDEVALTEALSLENAKDLLELGETIMSLIHLGMDIRKVIKRFDPNALLKLVCEVHIIYRYVLKTSWKDFRDLQNLAKLLWVHRDAWWDFLSIARGRAEPLNYQKTISNGKTYSVTMNCRLDCRPAQYDFMTYLRQIGGIGLEQCWDVVPYSFLVDWVLPVGDTVAAYGALIDLQHLNKLIVVTARNHRPIDERIYPGVLLHGASTRFIRTVSRDYTGTWDTLDTLQVKNPLKNFWTALALVIASITRR